MGDLVFNRFDVTISAFSLSRRAAAWDLQARSGRWRCRDSSSVSARADSRSRAASERLSSCHLVRAGSPRAVLPAVTRTITATAAARRIAKNANAAGIGDK